MCFSQLTGNTTVSATRARSYAQVSFVSLAQVGCSPFHFDIMYPMFLYLQTCVSYSLQYLKHRMNMSSLLQNGPCRYIGRVLPPPVTVADNVYNMIIYSS